MLNISLHILHETIARPGVYCQNLPAVGDFIRNHFLTYSGIAQGQRLNRRHIHSVLTLVSEMMSADPQHRPTASNVAHTLGSNECCHPNVEDVNDGATLTHTAPQRATKLDTPSLMARTRRTSIAREARHKEWSERREY
jgi:hypothetical protein